MIELGSPEAHSESKNLPQNNKPLRYLSKEACRELVSKYDSHVPPIGITALHSGMCKGEILLRKWAHEDLNSGFVLRDRTENGERR